MNYLVGFKQFLKWFVEEHKRPDYNDLIKTIKITRKPSDKNPSDLLTEEEIFKMIEVADNDRDKAIIAVLHESGCREGELVSSQLKHIKFTNDCIFLTFPTGKTGTRTVPLIASITYLRKWFDLHPLKGDSGAPLWTTLRKKDSKYKAITEDSVLHIVHKLAERADIQKRCYPHLFRHTCATDLSQDLNESQMKEFLGWKQSSNMPSVYVHLSGQNIENAIRAKHGLVEQKKAEPKIQRCPRCHVVVSKNIESCDKCGTALGARVQQMDELVVEAMRKVILEENPEIFEKVAKVMLKKQTESINNSVKQSC
jgi:integrase/recombinase XerD